VFARYVAGETAYALAANLNERGIPSIETAWSQERVRQLLGNPRYAGIVASKGQRFDVAPQWTPIIDERTWNDAETMRESRTRAGSWSTSTKHLLSGKLSCAVCGSSLLARPDRGIQVYACTSNWCTSIRASEVDAVVEGVVLGRLADKRIIKALRSTPDTAPLVDELADLRKRRDAITDLLADGLLDRRKAREQAAVLTSRIDSTAARLTAMRRESPLTDLALARSVPTRWRNLGILDKRRVIEDLGMRVTISKGRKGRRAHGPDGKPVPDLSRIAIAWE